ncbi:hypothetical protein C8R44DRAFT_871242 [Mycena epipterygia]|nr:hypothetical protein C8R44DRAFT_871242 [Mycena epipterygia]
MSHSPQARAAHMRHANRAGGFGGLGDGFTGLGGFSFTFPGFGFDTTTKTTPTPTLASTTSTSTTASLIVTSSSASSTSTTSSSSSFSSVLPTTTSSTTSTTTTPLRVTTTASGTALHDNLTKVITHIASAPTSSFPAATTSASAVPSTSSALVAPVIGGVAGGVLGLAGLIFLVTFCLRRRRGSDGEDAVNFDPGSFRRSAMLITEPPTHQDTVARGYNPPAPPAMMERRQIYPQNPNYNTHSPDGLSPTSGNPLVFQAPFSPISPTAASGNPLVFQAPFSPISPSAASPVSAYDHPWRPVPTPVLTRNTSASSASSAHEHVQHAQYPALPTPRNSLPVPQNETEYMDLERNSVTPFQAAQYVEISKRLNTEVPKGLDTPAVDEFVVSKMPAKDEDLPPLPPKDPFSDAAAANEEDEANLPMVQELSFPAPPSPVHTTSSRYRVDSTPPTLPEIIVQSRVSVTSAYLSEAGTPSASGFPGGQTLLMNNHFTESPMGSRFPVTPSPLASSFTVPTPPAAATSFPAAAAQPRPDATQRQSVYTLYGDPEDAYGGI